MEKDKKINMSFSLRESVKKRFAKYCDIDLINKSQLIESLLIEYCDKRLAKMRQDDSDWLNDGKKL